MLDWIVTDYDPVTEDNEAERFADAVFAARTANPRSGIRLTTSELGDLAAKTGQTIDGQFIGVPPATTTALHDLVDLQTSWRRMRSS